MPKNDNIKLKEKGWGCSSNGRLWGPIKEIIHWELFSRNGATNWDRTRVVELSVLII